jgi:hypothetical protein
MESFKRKTAKEVAQWLDMEGLSLDVCDIFEDNEVDGESFLELSEADIKEMVSKIGLVKKIY